MKPPFKARFFLFVDLREFFFRFRVKGRKKNKYIYFFFSQSFFFLISPEKTVKLVR